MLETSWRPPIARKSANQSQISFGISLACSFAIACLLQWKLCYMSHTIPRIIQQPFCDEVTMIVYPKVTHHYPTTVVCHYWDMRATFARQSWDIRETFIRGLWEHLRPVRDNLANPIRKSVAPQWDTTFSLQPRILVNIAILKVQLPLRGQVLLGSLGVCRS